MFRLYYILTYPITLICLALVLIYRLFIRYGLTSGKCVFIPTCSQYALDSIISFGGIIGGVMALVRLCKCNPSNKGGYDFAKLNLLGNYKWKC